MRMLIGLAAGLVFCGAAAAQQTGAEKRIEEVAGNPAVQASNSFSIDLYKKLDKENAGKNLFYSPFSISVALAMTLDGARGDTALEMGRVLRLPEALRQRSAQEPWWTTPYDEGFQKVATRISQSKNDPKAEETRKLLVELRKEFAAAKQQFEMLQQKGKYDAALYTKTEKLATQINTLAKQVDQYELKVANGLFGEQTYPFKKEYVEEVDRFFGSGAIRNVDFLNNYAGERKKINLWVEEQTNNRIKDLLPDLPPQVARTITLVLINAIYFKGEWSTPFDEKRTKQEPFLAAAGKIDVPMMRIINKDARYAAFNADGTPFTTPAVLGFDDNQTAKYPGKDGFLVAEIPVKGDKLSMVVIVPQSANGLAAIESKLTGDDLTRWMSHLKARTVDIAMPKFKMETDYKLGDILKSMGMEKAFTPRVADFTAMSNSSNPDDRLYISKVLHKAFVEVNEKGAEAAAATAVMMARPTSVARTFPFIPEFRADRPFLFLIRDRDSGMVLFMGRMTSPK